MYMNSRVSNNYYRRKPSYPHFYPTQAALSCTFARDNLEFDRNHKGGTRVGIWRKNKNVTHRK